MRYMMFIKHTEHYRNATVPASLYEAMGGFIEQGRGRMRSPAARGGSAAGELIAPAARDKIAP